jgi:hypothetical protein
MTARRPWIVTPHSPLRQLEENLWTVDGQVPGAPMSRRMCIVKRADGKLLFFHAIPLDDATLAQVKALGEPAYLVIAHDQHGIDADAFQKKLGLKLYGPKRSEAKLRAKFDLDGTLDDVPKDADVEVFSVDGAKSGEAMIAVKSKGGTSLLYSDVVMNVKQAGFVMRLMGFVGGPKTPAVWRMFFIADKKALKAQFEQLAARPGLKALVPCHGDLVCEGAAQALQQVAAAL